MPLLLVLQELRRRNASGHEAAVKLNEAVMNAGTGPKGAERRFAVKLRADSPIGWSVM
jgi:hypothetical protein